MRISAVMTGGQSGADRGAFIAARAAGCPIKGWCPAGGWAEDYPEPPGLLADFPEMTETAGDAGTATRTEWNIRDSDYCLVLTESSTPSPGTDYGMQFFEKYGVPYMEISIEELRNSDDAGLWEMAERVVNDIQLKCGERDIVLGAGGPRASENEHAFEACRKLVKAILEQPASKRKD